MYYDDTAATVSTMLMLILNGMLLLVLFVKYLMIKCGDRIGKYLPCLSKHHEDQTEEGHTSTVDPGEHDDGGTVDPWEHIEKDDSVSDRLSRELRLQAEQRKSRKRSQGVRTKMNSPIHGL